MSILLPYPGTPQHQKLLQAIVSHYSNDPRILAIIVFGSLGHGNWDPYSDVDLDIIIADTVPIDISKELEHLIYSFPDTLETGTLIIPHESGLKLTQELPRLYPGSSPRKDAHPRSSALQSVEQ